MRRLLLTSAGFENIVISDKFLELVNKKPIDIKVIFIPTAAITKGAKAMLPKCKEDLTKIGIPEENILIYNLDKIMTYSTLSSYDAVYFCGGSPQYLLDRIHEMNFADSLLQFTNNGGIYIGVSAGSIIATNNLIDNLGYINCTLNVHMPKGSHNAITDISNNPHIDLTDNQAILVLDNNYCVLE